MFYAIFEKSTKREFASFLRKKGRQIKYISSFHCTIFFECPGQVLKMVVIDKIDNHENTFSLKALEKAYREKHDSCYINKMFLFAFDYYSLLLCVRTQKLSESALIFERYSPLKFVCKILILVENMVEIIYIVSSIDRENFRVSCEKEDPCKVIEVINKQCIISSTFFCRL